MGQYRENTAQCFRRSGINPNHGPLGDSGVDRMKVLRTRWPSVRGVRDPVFVWGCPRGGREDAMIRDAFYSTGVWPSMWGIADTGLWSSSSVGISAATSEACNARAMAQAIQPPSTNRTEPTAIQAAAPGRLVSWYISQPMMTVEGW